MASVLFPSEIFWGERLQLAREFCGFTQTQLAEKVAASCALISLCENGKKREPTRDLVEAWAEVLGFQPGFFYGPVEEVFREDECSFRHRRSTPERLKTQVRAHATLIAMVINRLRASFKFPEVDVPCIPARSFNEVEKAADDCRKHWKISLDSPIKSVGRLLERSGVIIVNHLAKSAKIDAFSRYGRTSVIFLNRSIPSPSRWHFDIAHECGHLVLHRGIPTGTVETEAEADRFASAFLMPKTAFSREFSMAPFSWNHVFELKRRWQTSAASIVRRAYDLGLIGAVDYRRGFQYLSAKGWNKAEPHEPSFQEPELLSTTLGSLGDKVDLTLEELCSDLKFKPETFCDITGVAIPVPKTKSTGVISFKQFR
ncbi:MAG TPA: XRE family transcriptional regulator [Candidatus Angelobacter sp.]|jgi:Zn-dependent peptidase ImmA (M78 family)/DNA-binding XRE family transcriptional regulator|nr:XRE family transcriptional regulator [Candidatus Angelobacter sp.]